MARMDGPQDLTVLWTDIERVLAEMEQAVQAVVTSRAPEPGLLLALITDLQRLQRDCEMVRHLSHQQESSMLLQQQRRRQQQQQQQLVRGPLPPGQHPINQVSMPPPQRPPWQPVNVAIQPLPPQLQVHQHNPLQQQADVKPVMPIYPNRQQQQQQMARQQQAEQVLMHGRTPHIPPGAQHQFHGEQQRALLQSRMQDASPRIHHQHPQPPQQQMLPLQVHQQAVQPRGSSPAAAAQHHQQQQQT